MLAAGCPVVGREMLATGFPNDWLDQMMTYQLIKRHHLLCILDWLIISLKLSSRCTVAACWSLPSQSPSAEFLARKQNAVISIYPNDINLLSLTSIIICCFLLIVMSLLMSSLLSFPAGPSSSSSVCSWFLSFQLDLFTQIHQEHLKDMILMEIQSLEKKLTEMLEQQDSFCRGLFKNVRQDIQKTALSMYILTAQRKLSAQQIVVVTGLDDIRKDVKDQKAALSTELEDRLAAVSNDLLEFHAQAQENYNNLSSQLGELIAYISRGSNDKKGERSQQPPPGDRGRSRGDRSGSSSSEPHRIDASYWLRG
ncbi:hypothetical protein F511_41269 [Dorcoceras hygrometricum]|uniref:Uncharacterized protein n=1 Tax=Dorcoceras hygrometricum TaxID=472368 RepID=A0A2Z7D505_9LAMI|nr:hypothetical protein F511_41269 [Dorcoceras hygrometricum]